MTLRPSAEPALVCQGRRAVLVGGWAAELFGSWYLA